MVVGTAEQTDRAVILENAEMRLTIRPDLGGRIDHLYDRRTEHEWLWHPPGYEPNQTRSLPLGASFDDHWTGGWDEIFPNDVAGDFRGYLLVDHGEFWSQAWEVIETSKLHVRLAYHCQTVPVKVEKTIRLNATQPDATIEYHFQNESDQSIPFLFKQHAAIAIEAGDEIRLPQCLIEPVDLGFSRIIGQQKQTSFPKAVDADGQDIELHRIPPPSSQLQEFYYSSQLAQGECGIWNARSQSALLMRFDTADFPYVWVFQSYGAWRDYYVLVMEPSTTMPYDLEVACQNGTVAQLPPHGAQHRVLTISLQRSSSSTV